MKTTAQLFIIAIALSSAAVAHADTFGVGANKFSIDFVYIGDPDNPDDTTGKPNPVGKVENVYRIGKYEISQDMVVKANALGGLGIYYYDRGANKAATGITWFEAARFVNWLNTSTEHTPAYKFNGDLFELWQPGEPGYNPANRFRNSEAFYFLPSADEWYKAAYYDPAAGVYYDYPTGSNSPPTAVASGTAANTAVFSVNEEAPFPGPADATLAGGLSPYGTMGQGGNVLEYEETEFDLINDSQGPRGVRGGSWMYVADVSRSSVRELYFGGDPRVEHNDSGFRVASIPEPSAGLLGAMAVGGLLTLRRRGIERNRNG